MGLKGQGSFLSDFNPESSFRGYSSSNMEIARIFIFVLIEKSQKMKKTEKKVKKSDYFKFRNEQQGN